ncbi:MAG: type II toxin-antitoxin system HicA family toxin [Nitrospirae bacterium]|nr:type II toxin-antitoxin system HicA family toxin [Nitrospirota bacterium]
MPKIRPNALKHRELLARLKEFGIIEVKDRGKGSERVLILKASLTGSKYTGPQIPIKCHGEGTEHSVRVIDAVLRRFSIDPNKFWTY